MAGDVEVQVLLNEEGTLRAKVFNRQNEIEQFLNEQQGYTQGIGISYQVDFSTFKELMQIIFKSKEEEEEDDQQADLDTSDAPNAVMGKDSLIRFYPKTNPPKS